METCFFEECIFCNSSQMSFEHFWPKWLGKKYPNVFLGTHAATSVNADGSIQNRRAHRKNLKIRAKDVKVQVVCQSCNNGWMSQVESNGKRAFEKLPTIEHEALATWLALRTIVTECKDLKTSIINSGMRRDLSQNTRPDFRWAMYIAKIKSKPGLGFNHVIKNLSDGTKAQNTGLHVGEYFLLSFSTTNYSLNTAIISVKQKLASKLLQFWPPSTNDSIPVISEQEASECCKHLAGSARFIRESWESEFKMGDEPLPPMRNRKLRNEEQIDTNRAARRKALSLDKRPRH